MLWWGVAVTAFAIHKARCADVRILKLQAWLGAVAAIVLTITFIPGFFLNHASVTNQHYSAREGLWFRFASVKVDLDQVTGARLVRNGSLYRLEFDLKDGTARSQETRELGLHVVRPCLKAQLEKRGLRLEDIDE